MSQETVKGREARAHAAPLRHRLRYRFDNLLARGTWAVLVWLGAVTFAVLLVSSVLLTISGVTLAGSEEQSWLEDFWQTMLRALDTGTMAGDVGWGRRVLALVVTIFGVLIAGTLIGVIASGVEDRVDRMRRGRSAIVESGHVVVLGGSDRLPVVVEQLALASARRGGTAIVVLADCDPAELTEAVRGVVPDLHGSRLVIRSGDPASPPDLRLVRLDRARAAIVLSDVGGDVGAAKSVLAIGAELGGYDRLRVVVELVDTVEAERLARACGGQVHTIVPTQGIGRIAAFALRQSGLGQLLEELLDFRGCDLHVHHRPELTGTTFGSIVGHFENARIIGRMSSDGLVELAPPPDTVLEPGERLILIADDLEMLVPSDRTPEVGLARPQGAEHSDWGDLPAQHLMVFGWNRFGAELLANWATFAAPDSALDVVVDPDLCDPATIAVPGLDDTRLAVSTSRPVDTTTATAIVMFGYSDRLCADAADVRTLIDLVMLRREVEAGGGTLPHVIVELSDSENRSLAGLTIGDDDVVSQAIGSQFVAQLAEQPERRNVLLAIYGPEGPSIRLVAAERLGLAGEVSGAAVVATSYAAGSMAIGWRRRTPAGVELRLNPSLGELVRLAGTDEIVVIG